MEQQSSLTLDDALIALRQLPEAAQSVIAAEILERVAEFSEPHLNSDQRAEIKQRLAGPRRIVDDGEMQTFFARYGAGP